MQQSILRVWAISLACLFLWQCSPKEVTPSLIPADVSAVAVLDMKRMSSKAIEWKDMLSSDFWSNMIGSGNNADLLGKMLNGGLDYTKEVYAFGKVGKNIKESYTALAFTIKEVKQFEKTLKADNEFIEIKKDGGNRYTFFYSNLIVMWHKQKALLVFAPQLDQKKLRGLAHDILKTTKSEGLENQNENFRSALQQDADITTWVDYKNLPETALEQLENIGFDLPTQFKPFLKVIEQVTLHTNFEQGEIKTNIKTFCAKDALQVYEKLLKGAINPEVAKDIPIENPALLLSVGVGTQGLEGLLGNSTLISGLKILLKMSGTSLEDIFKLYTGDVVLAIDNPKLSAHLNEQEIIIGVGSNNAKEVLKLITSFDGFLRIKNKKDYYVLDLEEFKLGEWFMLSRGNNLYFTTSEKLKQNFLDNNIKLQTQTTQLFNGKVAVLELDYGAMLKNLPELTRNTHEMREKITNTIDRFQSTAKPWSNNVWEGESTLKMKDKNRNSLAVLFEMLRQMKPTIAE
jgi:hypothetical protein